MYYVYKYIDPATEECLYVGKTEDIYVRHSSHLSNKEEGWCNKELILKYIELPRRYNMDFFEVYLINELNPIFNKLSKGDMDTEHIFFDYKEEDWSTYSEEDFKEKTKGKRRFRERKIDMKYEVSKKSINFLKRIEKLDAKVEMLYENNILSVLYNFENMDIEFCENELDINLISYDFETLESFGSSSLISVYPRWKEYTATNKKILIDITLEIRVGSLANLMELMPTFEYKVAEIFQQIEDIFHILEVGYTWQELFEIYKGCKYDN
ncbi:GIY-YIG nuclease family protein [Clostridioides sp. ZZV14-6387]|uniref:GIY-YIG nuclease family protein n=1 Tax=Clostridioides sp. ZZV14-6387 TaxID=2811497 RepID=UPI001D0F5E4B|nr:GIY-YIG nuclease family protein [Clostridioides sp. ZZV14-6387]